MRVAITGASGLVGGRLVPHLALRGHEPVALVRFSTGRDLDALAARLRGAAIVEYDSFDAKSTAEAIAGCDGIVNLAGENLFARRWSAAFLKSLRDSRVLTTRALVQAVRAQERRPSVFVSASAVGFYGPRGPDEVCDEDELEMSFPGRDDLAALCREWEGEARRVARYGVREVRLRTGVVVSEDGGALQVMETPFRMGLGGRVGSGKQVMSWIHADDLCRVVSFALENPEISGAVNATAPKPVTNAEFTRALGEALSRPTLLPVPPLALRLLLGKVSTVVTSGQKALPTRLERAGFTWLFPTIQEALASTFLRRRGHARSNAPLAPAPRLTRLSPR